MMHRLVPALFLLLLACESPVEEISPQDLPVTLRFTTLANEQVVKGSLQIAVRASDPSRVDQLRLLLDGEEVAQSQGSEVSADWNTLLAEEGQHTIAAIASDGGELVVQDQISVEVRNELLRVVVDPTFMGDDFQRLQVSIQGQGTAYATEQLTRGSDNFIRPATPTELGSLDLHVMVEAGDSIEILTFPGLLRGDKVTLATSDAFRPTFEVDQERLYYFSFTNTLPDDEYYVATYADQFRDVAASLPSDPNPEAGRTVGKAPGSSLVYVERLTAGGDLTYSTLTMASDTFRIISGGNVSFARDPVAINWPYGTQNQYLEISGNNGFRRRSKVPLFETTGSNLTTPIAASYPGTAFPDYRTVGSGETDLGTATLLERGTDRGDAPPTALPQVVATASLSETATGFELTVDGNDFQAAWVSYTGTAGATPVRWSFFLPGSATVNAAAVQLPSFPQGSFTFADLSLETYGLAQGENLGTWIDALRAGIGNSGRLDLLPWWPTNNWEDQADRTAVKTYRPQ